MKKLISIQHRKMSIKSRDNLLEKPRQLCIQKKLNKENIQRTKNILRNQTTQFKWIMELNKKFFLKRGHITS